MATIFWILCITGVINEALAQHLLSRATGDLCTPDQIEAKCCEPAFEQSSGGGIEWTTTESGGGAWETAKDYIRFNIANDKKCGGDTDKRQIGEAVLEVDNDHTKILVLSMEGKAEAGYETMKLFLDGKEIEKIQAEKGESGCQASTCNMCDVSMDEKELELPEGKRSIKVKIDTNDGAYHSGAYFKIKFDVKQKDVCKKCKCESCDDGILNQDEEKIDCGGSCPACPETCDDGILNQDEEQIDCGGSCPGCPVDCEWGEFKCSGSVDAFCSKDGWRNCTRSRITEAENGGKDCEELDGIMKKSCQACNFPNECWGDFPYCINDFCEDLDDGESRSEENKFL